MHCVSTAVYSALDAKAEARFWILLLRSVWRCWVLLAAQYRFRKPPLLLCVWAKELVVNVRLGANPIEIKLGTFFCSSPKLLP